MDIKLVFGAIAVIISILSYIPYFRDIFAGKTKPHIFTWIVWTVMSLSTFAAQIISGAGAGSWVNFATGLICLAIALLSIKYGSKDIRSIDKVCFLLALIAFATWFFTKNPLYAVLIITTADALAFTITFRKTYAKPHTETLSNYALAVVKHIFALLALQTYTLTTVLFSVYLMTFCTAFVIIISLRRHTMKNYSLRQK